MLGAGGACDGAVEAERDTYDPANDPEVARAEASEDSTGSDDEAVSDADSYEAGASPTGPDAQRAQHGASSVMRPGLGDDCLPSDADLAAMGMDAEEWQMQRALALSLEAGSPADPPPSDPQGSGQRDCPHDGHCSGRAGNLPSPSSKPAAEGSKTARARATSLPTPRTVGGSHSELDASQSPAAGAADATMPKLDSICGSAGGGPPAAGASGMGAKRSGSGAGKAGTKKRRRGGLQASDEELEAAFAVVASGRSHVMLHSIMQVWVPRL